MRRKKKRIIIIIFRVSKKTVDKQNAILFMNINATVIQNAYSLMIKTQIYVELLFSTTHLISRLVVSHIAIAFAHIKIDFTCEDTTRNVGVQIWITHTFGIRHTTMHRQILLLQAHILTHP